MKTFNYKTKYCDYQNCHFDVQRYIENDNLAIRVMSEIGEHISTITVNPSVKCTDDYIYIKDYSENEGVYDWLVKENIIEPDPVNEIPSGWVIFKSYKLTEHGKSLLEI